MITREQTKIAINRLLGSKAFIEQTYDGCIGVLRLADKYGNARLEAACRRANTGSRINYKILQQGVFRDALIKIIDMTDFNKFLFKIFHGFFLFLLVCTTNLKRIILINVLLIK